MRLTAHLVELWRFRHLVWNLTARDVKVKYQRSWLGFLWTLLNPVLTAGILMAVFSFVVRIPMPHYWAFLISGYFVWSFCSQTLNGGVQAAVGNAYLTRSAYFPQEVLIISAALARLVEFLGEIAIVLVLLAFFHHKGLPVSFLLFIPLLPILFLLVLGLSLPVITLAVYYDDVVQAMPLATMALFYASPVFYPVEMVPEGIRTIYSLNPFALLLSIYHTVLYRGEIPDMGALITLAGVAVVLVFAGYAVFNWKKREFTEIV